MPATFRRIVLVGACIAWCAMPALTQTSTATLSGIVRDQQKAVIPGANVTIVQTETGRERRTVTSSTGDYAVTTLDVGHYTLTVSAEGFKTGVIEAIPLDLGQQARVDVTLDLGSINEKVTVSDVVPLLATTNSSIGQVVENQSIENLALVGRQFWRLVSLTPGVTYLPTGESSATGGSSIRADALNIYANGSGRIVNGWQLDGADITEYERGGTTVQPNVDALGEMKLTTSNMSAEYGHTPNTISATLKSGTNSYHGNLFEFLRNDKVDARNFFALSKNALKQNQFGGTFGGPIRRNKVFFFSDMESTLLRQGTVFNSTVPDDAIRSGNFSEFLLLAKPQTLKDPLSGAAFPGNIIPTSRISPQAAFFLPYMPTQSQARFNAPTRWNTYKGDIKVDAALTNLDHLMARYSINNNDEEDPSSFPALGSTSDDSRGQSATIAWTRILNPHLLNEARFAYYRSIFLLGGVDVGTNFLQKAGIVGFENSQIQPSFPTISISGWSSYNGSGANPKSNRIRTWQYNDSLSYTGGKHDMKFGVQLYHQTHAFFNGQNQTGSFSFQTTYTGNGMGDFLLGDPNNVTRSYPIALYGNWANQWALFWQDNYRVTPTLTLNVGLRWEFNPFYSPIRGQTSGFDYANGKLIVPMRNGQLADPTAQPDESLLFSVFQDRLEGNDSLGLPDSIRRPEKDWAPRIGFAWRPGGNNKLVVRGAYGIFYIFLDTDMTIAWAKVPPFIASQTVNNDTPTPTRTFANFFQGQQLIALNPNPGKPCPDGPANLVLLSCVEATVYSAAPNLRQTYMQQWNFSVQRQIMKTLSLEAGYVGNKTTHVGDISVPGNDPPAGPGSIQQRRPYPQWGRFQLGTMDQNADYDALQAKVEKRFAQGFQLLASYAYSKCIDTGSNKGTAPAQVLIGKANRGPCDFNMPSVLTTSSVYGLPFGQGRQFLGNANRLVKGVLGGWDLGGILTLRSGLPYAPTISSDVANVGASGERPIRLGPGTVANPTVSDWFAVGDFATPAAYTWGNSGRNFLKSDGLMQLDLSLMKRFAISESKRVEVRAEAYNLTNTATFSAPNSNINSTAAGQVTSTLNAGRMIDFGMKFFF